MASSYIRNWFKDTWNIFVHELRTIVRDGGVMIIFTVGAMGYPLLYSLIYHNGVLEDTPVAIVDLADCSDSRRFIREIDATRELSTARKCTSMEEAQRLLQKRKVNGIVMIPEDFGDKLAHKETAILSIYADMSSFLYYKNLLMGTSFVMLHEIESIQVERYCEAGYTPQEAWQLTKPILYEEKNPYNPAFSYMIFFLSAALLLVVQQTMFYGMCMIAGTMRENNHSFASLPDNLKGRGIGRVVWGRGGAYWVLYMFIAMYIAYVVPAIGGLPQRGSYWDILMLLLLYVTDCVFFCMAWSTLITRRETVFILLLFISPVAMFLTGFSWPEQAFPAFWKYFSYIFPSTFACRAFINLNTAGGDLETVRDLLMVMVLQGGIYCFLAHVAVYVENWTIHHREDIRARRMVAEKQILERNASLGRLMSED